MRYLLETSALLAHYRQETGWDTVQTLFESAEIELIIASLTLAEFGRRLCELGSAEDEARETLASYQLLFSEVAAVDASVAMAASTIGCRATQRIPPIDTLIAAVAQSKQATLVHRDEHMRHVPIELVAQLDLSAPPQACQSEPV